MELHLAQGLSPAFFSPVISTTVRSLMQVAKLALLRSRFRLLRTLAPARAVPAAARLFLTPPRHPFSEAEFAALEEASLLPVALVTGRLVGWRWGAASAPCVVLVHGWGGRGAQLHHFVQPLLARGFAVVAFDAPGHGMTGGSESSIVHFATALEAVMARLGQVHALIGHSMGAAAAAYVQARRGSASRAVLIAPPASLLRASRGFAALAGLPEALRDAMQRSIQHRFGVDWAEFEAESQVGPQPLLVIHDAGDREVPLAEGRRYATAWPAARLLVTEGLGHNRILADPGVLAATVDFVARGRP